MSLAARLWNRESGNAEQRALVAENSDQFLSWAEQPYHSKFLDWLYEQADAPLKVGVPHADLIAYTARANTFKEVRRHLQDQETKSRSILDRER